LFLASKHKRKKKKINNGLTPQSNTAGLIFIPQFGALSNHPLHPLWFAFFSLFPFIQYQTQWGKQEKGQRRSSVRWGSKGFETSLNVLQVVWMEMGAIEVVLWE